MFKDRKLLVTGGTGSIGSSICDYFNINGCKQIYSTTTNLNKVKSNQSYITFNELNLNIPIFILKHPYKSNISDTSYNENKYLKNDIIINHIGYHLRNIQSFVELNYKYKRICIPKIWPEMEDSYFIDNHLKDFE